MNRSVELKKYDFDPTCRYTSMSITWENGQTMETKWPNGFTNYCFSASCDGKTELEIQKAAYLESRVRRVIAIMIRPIVYKKGDRVRMQRNIIYDLYGNTRILCLEIKIQTKIHWNGGNCRGI